MVSCFPTLMTFIGLTLICLSSLDSLSIETVVRFSVELNGLTVRKQSKQFSDCLAMSGFMYSLPGVPNKTSVSCLSSSLP